MAGRSASTWMHLCSRGGRRFAQVLCALFALVGALPLAAGLALEAPSVRDWAARETALILEPGWYLDPAARPSVKFDLEAALRAFAEGWSEEEWAVQHFPLMRPQLEASLALHRAFGFEPVGIFRQVGYKFGRYWDVQWFQKRLDAASGGGLRGAP